MDEFNKILKGMVERWQITPEPGDYEHDGLVHCGTCHTPRQTVTHFGDEAVVVPIMCKCRAEEVERQRQAEERRAFEERVKRARRIAIGDDIMRGWTFDLDDQKNPAISNAMRKYAAEFAQMRERNVGLLLHGPVGTGKTFLAACIVNDLCQAGYRVLMTSFVKIINGIPSGFDEERQKYFDSFNMFDLLVIDDLGAERQSDYMLEQVYNIIDARYRSKKPMIVTTNLDLNSISKPSDMRYARIYDRVMQMCHPVHVAGQSRRVATAAKRYKEFNELLGL
jgi:DNA replication protein DnaC